MVKLLMIADDFTGALDTGVQLASCGAVTRVVTGEDFQLETLADSCQVLVVDAETRHVSPERAYETVKAIVAQAEKLGIGYIYKKTDSALRGNIGAELSALVDASGEESLPFLPAFPKIRRITRGGIHYIDGVPVADSVFGQDPFEPVIHSSVAQLIGQQSSISVHSYSPRPELPQEKGIWVFDSATEEEQEQLGQMLLAEKKLHILAGCAGFASVLPKLLGLGTGKPGEIPKLDKNFLVICGSVNPITVEQVDRAEKAGFRRIRLAPEQKLDAAHWQTEQGREELEALKETIAAHPLRILDTNDLGGNQITAQLAKERGMDIQDVRKAVSSTIGYLVSQLFGCPELGTLLITGGDTLLECMQYMDVHEIQPLGEMASGVVLSRFTYQGVTRYVISKSGGFGDKDLMIHLARRISGLE